MTSSSVLCGLTEASFLSRRLFSFAELDLEVINNGDVIEIVAETELSFMDYNQANLHYHNYHHHHHHHLYHYHHLFPTCSPPSVSC